MEFIAAIWWLWPGIAASVCADTKVLLTLVVVVVVVLLLLLLLMLISLLDPLLFRGPLLLLTAAAAATIFNPEVSVKLGMFGPITGALYKLMCECEYIGFRFKVSLNSITAPCFQPRLLFIDDELTSLMHKGFLTIVLSPITMYIFIYVPEMILFCDYRGWESQECLQEDQTRSTVSNITQVTFGLLHRT